jgi:2-dehydropantoate 2-reductase
LLNGYNHFSDLQQFAGKDKILGGLCFIESSLDDEGAIIQSSQRQDLVFGEWEGSRSNLALSIKHHLDHAGFNVIVSENIQRDIWHKYIFIASMSGITTLMNAPIGPILADANGKEIYKRLISEVASIAKYMGAPIVEEIAEQTLVTTQSLNPAMKSSMQRDMEKKVSVEADHIHGALLSMAEISGEKVESYPILQTVYSKLKIYEK